MTAKRWKWAWLGVLLLSTPACMQKMADQPAYRPLEPSDFFRDGRSARPLELGVVPFGRPLSTNPLFTGLKLEFAQAALAGPATSEQTDEERSIANPAPGAPSDPAKFVDAFPREAFPDGMTMADLERGQERFTIYCAVCHGPLGDGKGKIFERGYLQPTSFLTENSRGFERFRQNIPMPDVPVGYYYEVISKGYGGMPSYAAQIKPEDRWRIIAYIRALQYSVPLDDLPDEAQETAREQLEGSERGEHE